MYFAHVFASLFIAGYAETMPDYIYIVCMGTLIDLDMALALFNRKAAVTHHALFTHTPSFAFLLTAISFLFLSRWLTPFGIVLGLISMLVHFLLDDMPYLLGKLGIYKDEPPQIFWLHPFDPRREGNIRRIYREMPRTDVRKIWRLYTGKYRLLAAIEAMIIIISVILMLV